MGTKIQILKCCAVKAYKKAPPIWGGAAQYKNILI